MFQLRKLCFRVQWNVAHLKVLLYPIYAMRLEQRSKAPPGAALLVLRYFPSMGDENTVNSRSSGHNALLFTLVLAGRVQSPTPSISQNGPLQVHNMKPVIEQFPSRTCLHNTIQITTLMCALATCLTYLLKVWCFWILSSELAHSI